MTLRWEKTSINWKGLKQKQATKTGKNNQVKKHLLENNFKPNTKKPEHQKATKTGKVLDTQDVHIPLPTVKPLRYQQ
jgi:hypothetical protein